MVKKKSKTRRKVARVMREHAKGKLRSGSGRKVKSRRQAAAIGYAMARRRKR